MAPEKASRATRSRSPPGRLLEAGAGAVTRLRLSPCGWQQDGTHGPCRSRPGRKARQTPACRRGPGHSRLLAPAACGSDTALGPSWLQVRVGDVPGVRCASQSRWSKPKARRRRPFARTPERKAPRCRAPPILSAPSFTTPSKAELPVGSLTHPGSPEGTLRRRRGWVPCPRPQGRSGLGPSCPGSVWQITDTDRCGFELFLFVHESA